MQAPFLERILARDRLLDGVLVFAVTTTRIYCRPSCPSRRPSPDHVRIYDTPLEARNAGFRACRRCHPDSPLTAEAALVRGATRLVTERIEGRWTVVRIAAALRVSTQRLQRAFQRETGLSAHAFLDAQRRERAAQALQAGASVRRAAQAAGFSSPQALYRKAGMTAFPPSVPRPIPKDLAIHYGIYESTMGTILIARTARGLCAVRFGLDARSLERELRKEFPAATLLPETRDDDWRVQEILQRVAGQPPGRSLPQDVRATAFQRRVWDALQSIPHGTTTTYGALARSIGRPSAVRAVARACATNPLAVVVPCHRVVASNGSLAGYRWGLSRKKRLLAKEADVRNE